MTQILKDILNLSVSERILMVEAIWDSIPENDEKLELSDETRQLLDDRLATHLNNPNEGSSWEEVKSRIKTQF
ncbi:MAG TPA: addiction module protein [Prolixibacteraceae bacterium]